MGTLLVQVGQCGNQIGLKLWDQLSTQNDSDSNFLFSQTEGKAHAILIDTEPKVLRAIKEDNRKLYSYIDPHHILYYQYGRGNNWAMGYHQYDKPEVIVKKKNLPKKLNNLSSKSTNTTTTNQLSSEGTILEKVSEMKKTKTTFKTSNFDKDFHDEQFILKENSHLLDAARSLIQKEIEKTDCYMGTMMLFSLAGGTGSGLGSRILESIKDDYRSNMVFNTVVFPNKSGETPLQHYNALLSLSHLQQYSDGIIYFQNDKCHQILSRNMTAYDLKHINIDDINEYIASLLGQLLKINDLKDYSRMFFDILSDITCMNECKFVELFGAPFITGKKKTLGPEASWENVIDQCLYQTSFDLYQEDMDDKGNKAASSKNSHQYVDSIVQNQFAQTIASTCILKSGDIDISLLRSSVKKYLEKKTSHALNPSKWNPDAINYEYIKNKEKNAIMDPKMMMVIANRTYISNILKEILDIARDKYKAKAYLHWYFKYGLEESDFEQAFELVNGIIDSYDFMSMSHN